MCCSEGCWREGLVGTVGGSEDESWSRYIAVVGAACLLDGDGGVTRRRRSAAPPSSPVLPVRHSRQAIRRATACDNVAVTASKRG